METKVQSSEKSADDDLNLESEKSIDFKNSNKSNSTLTEFYIVNDFNKSDEDKEKQLWTMTERKKQQRQIPSPAFDERNDIEIIRLRKQCQNLIEENRRLNAKVDECKMNPQCDDPVRTVILQGKLETIQWQLKQIENSRQMYRAILEEVARYLEKCHESFLMLQNEQHQMIERSKSISFIAKGKFCADEISNSEGTSCRARSSTTLNFSTPQSIKTKPSTFFSDLSYSAFKDFTWRRSPKMKIFNDSFAENVSPHPTSTSVTHQVNAEKLSKEAFRLLRTVQNFLCTHEPRMSGTQNNLIPELNGKEELLEKSDSNFSFEYECSSHENNSTKLKCDKIIDDESIADDTRTDDSNQSQTYSKCPLKLFKRFSTTEDESGFSSMNSFHEVGLPLPGNQTSMKEHFSMKNTNGPSPRKHESEKDPHNIQFLENDENMQCRVLWV